MKIYLASASPRRREILNLAGIRHSVVLPSVSEDLEDGVKPCNAVVMLSERKAEGAFALIDERDDDFAVIAADTVVALGDKIFGKPRNGKDAFEILRQLSGARHEVFTGVTIASPGKRISFFEQSYVYFNELSDEEIEAYISSGEPMDKAGAYGIQGRGCVFVKRIEGDFFNIMGLPVAKVYDALKSEFSYKPALSEE